MEFDEIVALALAVGSRGRRARSDVRRRLMQRVAASPDATGFAFQYASDDQWLAHPVPGIQMKVLALNKARGYATLLLDVAPGTRFPAHHRGGAEECFVVSGAFHVRRRLGPGDFVHATPIQITASCGPKTGRE